MTSRRHFIKASLLTTTGLVSGSLLAKKAPSEKTDTDQTEIETPISPFAQLPTGLIYTQENPGKWGKKVISHLPVVVIKEGVATITTDHSMSKKHYIVRHTLITQKGDVIGENTFSPTDEKAVSTFKLNDHDKENSTLYATSFCNKHDFWVTEITL